MRAALQEFNFQPGRNLVASPSWGDFGVIYDTRSGDFWVVSNEVHAALQAAQGCAAGSALQKLPHAVKENLVAHGIIQPSSSTLSASYPCQ
jgi:hypothetical protein